MLPAISELQSAVHDQDLARVDDITRQMAPHVSDAASLTSDPIWRATEVLPVIGPNLAAVRVASAQLDVLINDLAVPLLPELQRLRAKPGTIDVDALAKVADALSTADFALQRGQHDLDTVNPDALIPVVARGMAQLDVVTNEVAPLVHAAAPFMRIAPGLLGADGIRHTLVIVQNNAEVRTAGGISGTFVDLVTNQGEITLGGVASDAQFPAAGEPVATVPTSTSALYGGVVGTHVQNSTMPADFAVTARLASAWWRTHAKADPDVVAAIDPHVLAALLRVTGPVTIEGVALTADNAVHELLVNSYLQLAVENQDPFFSAVATAVFQRLTDGSADPLALVNALRQPLAEGRISLWSSHGDEQKVLGSGVLGGPSVRHRLAGNDAYAVYFNDATGAKMDPFLQTTITSGTRQCRPDGRRDVVIRVSVSSSAPKDAATSLPGPVTGWGLNGTPAGDIRTIVTVAAPAGTFLGGVSVDGRATNTPDVVDAGFPTSAATVLLEPGQKKTVQFRFTAAHAGKASPTILHTPMMNDPKILSTPISCR
ncbi:hypothetical protein GCM10022240_00130 [Microbacterium kribbense]|uniref:DUF4012 domain-containing protein n=1 Tax=Microbacterium kribbense TaxID=433645 RepID=A0ABP7FXI0_9MICO